MTSGGREAAAAASALGAYLTTVLPRTRRVLREWGPVPRDWKPVLREKERNAEAVAVFATLAPRSARATVVRAIVALQVAIDLRDLREEGKGPERSAELERLEASWRQEVAALPAQAAVAPYLERAVARCEEGQRQTHGAAGGNVEPLRLWAEGLGAPAGYRWWEVAAGASSSVAAHALIAAAADPGTTAEIAAAVDAVYYPPVGALTVLLDDLDDLDEDRAAGEHNYMTYYEDPDEAAARLGLIADRAAALLGHLPRAARHEAILAGVAAYYLGTSETKTELGRPIRERLLEGLGPGARLLAWFTRLRA